MSSQLASLAVEGSNRSMELCQTALKGHVWMERSNGKKPSSAYPRSKLIGMLALRSMRSGRTVEIRVGLRFRVAPASDLGWLDGFDGSSGFGSRRSGWAPMVSLAQC